jgi:hypothetical protein
MNSNLQKILKEQGDNFSIHRVEEDKRGDKKYEKVLANLEFNYLREKDEFLTKTNMATMGSQVATELKDSTWE